MKVEAFRSDKDSQWYVRLVADNGEPLMSSEGHRNKDDAVAIAEKIASRSLDFDIEVIDG